MKTSDLIGPALDWAVAKCSGDETRLMFRGDSETGVSDVHFDPWHAPWSPSTDWAQGGPIIEQEALTISTQMTRFDWQAIDFHGDITQFGPTPLIAAMRCYVASKIGNEINIPEELT